MRILVVCGMGIGTSILLKMRAEAALRSLGMSAVIEVSDIASAQEAAQNCDIVLTTAEFSDSIGDVPARVVLLDQGLSDEEFRKKLSSVLGVNQEK